MATLNKRKTPTAGHTHEGARSFTEGPIPALKRVLNAHMLWEDTFYIDGESAANQLTQAVQRAAKSDPLATGLAIMDARDKMNIRHASLLAAVEYAKAGGPDARDLITNVISRADELAEVLVMAGVQPGKPPRIPHAVRKGVRDAFAKFDEYQFGKYKGEGKAVSLRDAVFITHPKGELVNKIVKGTLAPPNTWERRLSSGEDKTETWTDLLKNNKLGAMALLRNLRNMKEAGVDHRLIARALEKATWSKVLPFRFMSAVQEAPAFATYLDEAFRKAVQFSTYLPGKTAVLIDSSGSMSHTLSDKSKVQLVHAAAVLGAAINGEEVELFEWASDTRQVPNFRSLSTAMTIRTGNVGHGTDLGQAMRKVGPGYDRYIIVSDMQFAGGDGWSHIPPVALPKGAVGYTLNVGKYNNPGLVLGDWTHITGFSTNILKYIKSVEE